jgi:tetratricopeptide (TPR) repeat protein
MPIRFFITDMGELYANMEETNVDDETFKWLSKNKIELGRKSSFKISMESPILETLPEAESWLTENLARDMVSRNEPEIIDSNSRPTEEHYENCARLAHEINEYAGMGELDELLPLEKDHSFLCRIGIWYWSLGHKKLAIMAYKRSIQLQPEAATYFNLAVCYDDNGDRDSSLRAMAGFYQLVPTDNERESAENMLRQQGKEHLIR